MTKTEKIRRIQRAKYLAKLTDILSYQDFEKLYLNKEISEEEWIRYSKAYTIIKLRGITR